MPVAANAADQVDPRLARVADLLVPDVQLEPQRRRVAALGLAPRADVGDPLDAPRRA